MRHEVRALHLCDHKWHCVVLYSSPRAIASQGSSRQSVPLRGHNWVLRGGQTGRLEVFWVFLLFWLHHFRFLHVLHMMLMFNRYKDMERPFNKIVSWLNFCLIWNMSSNTKVVTSIIIIHNEAIFVNMFFWNKTHIHNL
jgi:hypothetical protein